MISHSLKAIYFHIGKTAGTSVEKLIADDEYDLYKPNYEVFYGYEDKHSIYLQHASALFIYENLDLDVFNDYYKFTIVRNPYERLLSVYHYVVDEHAKVFGSFEGYIKALPNVLSGKNLYFGSHHLDQSSYTHIDGELVCDHIAHFESLPESFQPVLGKLNVTKSLEKHNSRRFYNWHLKPTCDYYSDEMVDIVTTLYADDFRNFAYSTDPRQRSPISS